MEFKLGHIISSVEATVSMRVTDGSWPSGHHGVLAAFARSCSPVFDDSVDREKIVLFDSGDEKKLLITDDDGKIPLSRRVVSVETGGSLAVYVEAVAFVKRVVETKIYFSTSKEGKSDGKLDMGFCKIQVTVNWSSFRIMLLVRIDPLLVEKAGRTGRDGHKTTAEDELWYKLPINRLHA